MEIIIVALFFTLIICTPITIISYFLRKRKGKDTKKQLKYLKRQGIAYIIVIFIALFSTSAQEEQNVNNETLPENQTVIKESEEEYYESLLSVNSHCLSQMYKYIDTDIEKDIEKLAKKMNEDVEMARLCTDVDGIKKKKINMTNMFVEIQRLEKIMTKKEIKSTDTGFVIVNQDNEIIHEFNENEAIEKLLKETQEIKSIVSEWVEHNKKYQSRLNDLTEDILTREEDTESHYWAGRLSENLEAIN